MIANLLTVIAEAIAAVHGAIPARLERKRGFPAAVGASRREALARSAAAAAAESAATAAAAAESAASAPLGLARGTTGCAALGLVHESTLLIGFLLAGGKHEGGTALNAGDVLVGKRHRYDS